MSPTQSLPAFQRCANGSGDNGAGADAAAAAATGVLSRARLA